MAVVKYPSTAYMPNPFSIYFPRRDWALVYWDDVVLVFVRRLPAYQALIQKEEFSTLEPDSNPSYWKNHVWEHASQTEKKRTREELLRNKEIHSHSRKVERWLGIISS